MSEILTRLRCYNPPDRTEWSGVLISRDLHDAADEIERLRDAIEIEREGQRSMARALAEINRLSRLDVAVNLAEAPR